MPGCALVGRALAQQMAQMVSDRCQTVRAEPAGALAGI
jgi:hypothetical protein